MEREVFHLLETTSNRGAVDEAYEYSFSASFVPSGNAYYDIAVNYEGTHYGGSDAEEETMPPKIEPFQKKVIYCFDSLYENYAERKPFIVNDK